MLATSLRAIERSQLPSPVAVRSCSEEVDMRGHVLRVHGPAASLTKGEVLALEVRSQRPRTRSSLLWIRCGTSEAGMSSCGLGNTMTSCSG